MFKNYLKVALRTLLKHKGYSLLNIAGLSLGMACSMLILLWVQDELSFDRFHQNARNLYRIEQDQPTSQGLFHVNVTPSPLGVTLKNDIPGIVDACRSTDPGTLLLRAGSKVFYETNARAVDPSYLRMFSFPLLKGDLSNALRDPHSLILTADLAKKYFGDRDPIGETVTINDRYAFSVNGVIENPPKNSTLQFDLLIPFTFTKEIGVDAESWGNNWMITWVQLNPSSATAVVSRAITDLVTNRRAAAYPSEAGQDSDHARFLLMPLTDLHLNARFGFNPGMGDIQYVYIFCTVALFVLLIACINYMNLSTARAVRRAKEVGLRKMAGALRQQLIGQFYGESLMLTILAAVFSLLLVLFLLPAFNSLSGKELPFSVLVRFNFLAGLFLITFVTGIISGSYPAFFLTAWRPVQILKGSLVSGTRGALFRKALVISQFSLSILLIIGTVVVYRQLGFMKKMELGYNKEQMIYLDLKGETYKSYEALKDALLREPRILGVSGTGQTPTFISSNADGATWDAKDPAFNPLLSVSFVDEGFIETMKIPLVEGRAFSKKYPTDFTRAFLVNEEVAKLMGGGSVVGKRFSFQDVDGTIIGVMKNFHYQPAVVKIEPLVLLCLPAEIRFATIRLAPQDIASTLQVVKSVWQRVNPNYPFEYRFFDDDFGEMYMAQERMGNLLLAFSIMAILIACIGLFGLASYTAELKTKEIGIRKVLGATVPGIVLMLSNEFAKWVLIANVIAWPAGYFIMKHWLERFAYKTSLDWWLFFTAGLGALMMAMLTVSYQAMRAAVINPVQSIRYE